MILDKLKAALPGSANGDQHLVALDIGTEYVKALIAHIEGDELKIIGVGRAHQELSDMHSGAISDIAGVVRNCEMALSDAEAQAGSLASWLRVLHRLFATNVPSPTSLLI
jgi:cell division protein FtsA